MCELVDFMTLTHAAVLAHQQQEVTAAGDSTVCYVEMRQLMAESVIDCSPAECRRPWLFPNTKFPNTARMEMTASSDGRQKSHVVKQSYCEMIK